MVNSSIIVTLREVERRNTIMKGVALTQGRPRKEDQLSATPTLNDVSCAMIDRICTGACNDDSARDVHPSKSYANVANALNNTMCHSNDVLDRL